MTQALAAALSAPELASLLQNDLGQLDCLWLRETSTKVLSRPAMTQALYLLPLECGERN